MRRAIRGGMRPRQFTGEGLMEYVTETARAVPWWEARVFLGAMRAMRRAIRGGMRAMRRAIHG